jgi:hypothetical protein
MKYVIIALALSATAATAQSLPVPNAGTSCPWGYAWRGSYCVPLEGLAQPTIPAPPNNGPCPYGFARQNGYCIKP